MAETQTYIKLQGQQRTDGGAGQGSSGSLDLDVLEVEREEGEEEGEEEEDKDEDYERISVIQRHCLMIWTRRRRIGGTSEGHFNVTVTQSVALGLQKAHDRNVDLSCRTVSWCRCLLLLLLPDGGGGGVVDVVVVDDSGVDDEEEEDDGRMFLGMKNELHWP